jgi:hypothetical protein
MINSVPLQHLSRIVFINPICLALFGSGPIKVPYQTLKKSISAHPFLGQILPKKKLPCFEIEVI